jgi:excisionase family DNA binding protein
MPLLDWDECAEQLNISPSTLRRLVRAGKLPVVRIGRRVLFSSPTVEAYVSSCTRTMPAVNVVRVS